VTPGTFLRPPRRNARLSAADAKASDSCAGAFFAGLRKARETFCLSTCSIFEGLPFFGSLTSRVHVLGHHHVTDQQKSESRADLVQYLHKTVARAVCSKIPPAPITTEGYEMKGSAPVKAPQRIAHERKPGAAEKSTRTLEKHKGAAPTRTSTSHKG